MRGRLTVARIVRRATAFTRRDFRGCSRCSYRCAHHWGRFRFRGSNRTRSRRFLDRQGLIRRTRQSSFRRFGFRHQRHVIRNGERERTVLRRRSRRVFRGGFVQSGELGQRDRGRVRHCQGVLRKRWLREVAAELRCCDFCGRQRRDNAVGDGGRDAFWLRSESLCRCANLVAVQLQVFTRAALTRTRLLATFVRRTPAGARTVVTTLLVAVFNLVVSRNSI